MTTSRCEKSPTRVVIRGLPNGIGRTELLYCFYSLPPYNHFYVAENGTIVKTTRAYINFYNYESMLMFIQENQMLDIIGAKGTVYKPKIELAPNQKVLLKRRKKPDPICGTIESDKVYQQFLRDIEGMGRNTSFAPYDVYEKNTGASTKTTPLLKYVNERRSRKESTYEGDCVIFVNSTKKKPKNKRWK